MYPSTSQRPQDIFPPTPILQITTVSTHKNQTKQETSIKIVPPMPLPLLLKKVNILTEHTQH